MTQATTSAKPLSASSHSLQRSNTVSGREDSNGAAAAASSSSSSTEGRKERRKSRLKDVNEATLKAVTKCGLSGAGDVLMSCGRR